MACSVTTSPYTDWENDLATVIINNDGTSITIDKNQAGNVKIKDRVKLDCCLGLDISGYNINHKSMCSKNWCPQNGNSECNDVVANFCSDDNIFGNYHINSEQDIGSGCYNYCLQTEGGISRKDIEGHWCNAKVKDFCNKGYKLMYNSMQNSNPICNSFLNNKAQQPKWVEQVSQDICATLKDVQEENKSEGRAGIKNYDYCGCVNSDEFAAACLGAECTIDGKAFVPSTVRKGSCPQCIQMINACAGARINISDITMKQYCNNTTGISKTFYGCKDNKCVKMDQGQYENDDTCGGTCSKESSTSSAQFVDTNSSRRKLSFKLIFVLLLIVLFILFSFMKFRTRK